MAQPLLLPTTRLRPPCRKRGLLPRPRLEDSAADLLEHDLTILQTPPGYGKTTLAAAWFESLATQGINVAWLTLDRGEDTPLRLLHCLAAALEAAAPAPVVSLPAFNAGKNRPDLSSADLATLLINDLHRHAEPLLMVLDDVQQVEAALLDEALRPLLRHAPPQLHLLLISRHALAASLLSQARSQPVRILDIDELRFTPHETQALLERAGRTPTTHELISLQNTTAGWIAALRASLLAGRGDAPRGETASLARRMGGIFDEMLAGLAGPVRDRLLPLGLLESFDEALLAHCQNHEADALIDTLEQRQTFIAAQAPEGDGFRFSLHPLFREHLTRLLERADPERARLFRRQAAAWLAAQGHWSPAITLALAAGEAAQAQEWLQRCARDLVEQGEFLVLLQWYRQLKTPPAGFPPPTRLALAWAAALAMQHDEASRLLESLADDDAANSWECRALRATLLALDDQPEAGARLAGTCLRQPDGHPWILNVLINVQRYACLQASQWQALYGLPPLQSHPLSSTCYTFNRLYQNCMEALADIQQANLSGAAARLENTFAELAQSEAVIPVLRAFPAAFLARIRLLQGRAGEAVPLLADCLPFVRLGGFLDFIVTAQGSSAALLRQQGQLAQARQRVDEIEAMAHHRQWPRLLALALLERGRISLRELKFEEARACIARLRQLNREHPRALGPDSVAQAHMLAALEFASATGEYPPTLIADAEQLAADLGAAQLRLPQMELHLTMIELLRREGRMDEAERKSGTWREIARQTGALALLGASSTTAEVLPRSTSPRIDPRRALTVKERLVLQCVARGQSNKVIAKAMGVTPETIKTHLKNIYSKLDVHSRAQAAAFITSGTDGSARSQV